MAIFTQVGCFQLQKNHHAGYFQWNGIVLLRRVSSPDTTRLHNRSLQVLDDGQGERFPKQSSASDLRI